MYFITTMTGKGHSRCVGYFYSLGDAIDAVRKNKFDINEAGEYPYAVIESIDEGLYQYDSKPLWFKWDKEKEGYISSDKPHFIKDYFIGFAMG